MTVSPAATAEKLLAAERARIDELDSELIRILGERVQACASIARIKSDANIPMMQPDRLADVRDRLVEKGRSAGLEPEFVAELHTTITRETCRIEDELMGNAPGECLPAGGKGSQILAIDHVAVAVEDLESAVEELTRRFGFDVIERRSVDGKHSGMVSATLRAGQATVVVCQGTSAESNVSQYIAHRGPGVQHVALSTSDHQVLLADLRAAGADLLTGIIHAPGLDQTFTRRSPATGLQLEFVSRTEHTSFEDDNVRELFESMERENVW